MSDSEAVEVVHQMIAARDHEETRAAVAAPKHDAGATRRRFWKEVAIYPLTLACVAAYALLLAVAQ